MIGFILNFLLKRRGIVVSPTTRTITELLDIGGRVADYLVKVEEEAVDNVKFAGAVADWMVKYIPPDNLPVKGSVGEYGVRTVVRESIPFGGLVWTYRVSVINEERLNIACYIKTYTS